MQTLSGLVLYVWLTSITSYVAISPASFRIGDIVEAQLSFIAYPTRNGHTLMRLVLRLIALLNGQFTQVRLSYLVFEQS
jgi:hypothetical protein